LKKPTGSVRFFKPGTGKTEPNRKKPEKNRAKPKKPSQNRVKPKKSSQTVKNRAKTEPNRFEPVFSLKNQTEPNQTETGRFELVSVCFFLKKFGFVTFFYKNRTVNTPSFNILI